MQNSLTKSKPRAPLRTEATPPRFAGEMLAVLTDIMSVESLDAVLQKIADTIAELFSMRALVIGVLDEAEQIFRVRATFGYEGERDKKIKKFTYSKERVERDTEAKYKIAENVFLVRPSPGMMIKGEEAFYKTLGEIHSPRTDPSVWHELDYIRFILRNKDGVVTGFIEINEPETDKVPQRDTIEAMQTFCQLAGVATENATLYQRQFEIAQRSRFLSDIITHDINNQNQAVTSYLQLAMNLLKKEEKLGVYLEHASNSAWQISGLIQRAHKLMRIEDEGAENLGPMELGEVLKESVEEVLRRGVDRAVKFDLELGTKRYFVLGNELANEIFTNILENAVTYDPHDKVSVQIEIGEFMIEPRKYWCVSIADNGIGIPDSKKNIVFGRYRSLGERPHGSGIGLSIVRALVEAYRGMVWVEDRVPGDPSKGSVFRVALPMVSGK